MKFCFWGFPLDYTGDLLESKNVGGSECAVFYMAQELRNRGHDVEVVDATKPDPRAAKEYDVFVAVRYPEIFNMPIKARVKVLWCHDIPVNHAEIKKVFHRIDYIFVLSYFHRDSLLHYIPEAAGKIWITSGGVDLANVEWGGEKEPGLVLYTSRPERGLEVLKGMKLPEGVRLEVTGYLENRLTKREYYQLLARAQLVLYPCTFPEIFCCAAVEAQASGTPIITTNEWALRETVADPKNRINGDPRTEEYQKAFLVRVEELLGDPKKYGESQNIGCMSTLKFDWAGIARSWEDRLIF